MHDSDTNEVYFSTWLKDKRDGHPEFYHRLIDLLNDIGITTKSYITRRITGLVTTCPFNWEKKSS